MEMLTLYDVASYLIVIMTTQWGVKVFKDCLLEIGRNSFVYRHQPNQFLTPHQPNSISINRCIIGIIGVEVGVYQEIVYSASLFNRLNDLGFASVFNLLNNSAS